MQLEARAHKWLMSLTSWQTLGEGLAVRALFSKIRPLCAFSVILKYCLVLCFYCASCKKKTNLFSEKEQGKSYYVLPMGLTNGKVHKRGADCKKDFSFQWNPGQIWLSNMIPKENLKENHKMCREKKVFSSWIIVSGKHSHSHNAEGIRKVKVLHKIVSSLLL